MSKIRIVLIEDHHITRVGLIAALQRYSDIQVVGEAANGKQGLALLKQTSPDVAVVDIGLPEIDGIELTRQFKEYQAQQETPGPTKILILTMSNQESSVLAAFAAGADSYSIKDVEFDNLVKAIRSTHEDSAWIDPAIARVVLKQAQQKFPRTYSPSGEDKSTVIGGVEPDQEDILETVALTKRELDVLELIVAGYSNQQIASKLYVTEGTVKTHVRNLLNKLCVDDRTQAAVLALRAGLVY
ncbi:MAG: response regulator transcription factor [Okeania sp. SIO2D1]|nr:response regulator transcription factor [Okeania sp. SIO2D1]